MVEATTSEHIIGNPSDANKLGDSVAGAACTSPRPDFELPEADNLTKKFPYFKLTVCTNDEGGNIKFVNLGRQLCF